MIRTLVVDDQNIIREGIKVLLEGSTDIELVGFAVDGETALKEVEASNPDVVLLDINLPGIDGLTVANQINAAFPEIKVIMLSSYEEEKYVGKAMASSAKGYLLKNVSAEELEWSIKLVHQGYSAFKSELLTSYTESKQKAAVKPKALEEIEVVSVNQQDNTTIASSKPNNNSSELELRLAKNQVRQKYSKFKKQRRGLAFHDVNVSRAKKTMMSFEFKLLVFIVLFSLGLLVSYALS